MILLNGEPQQNLPATDRGLHYGDGVFETIAVVDGNPQLWSSHMRRLHLGCETLGIPLADETLLQREAGQLCAGLDRAVLKIIITRGSGGRGYRPPATSQPNRLLFRYPWPDYADSSEALHLRLCRTPLACNPVLAGIKHLNRLEHVIARSEWDDEGIAEGLMCDLHGNLIEGTMSNLFCVRNGVLLTPDLSRCGVEGIMRAEVLALADSTGIPYEVLSFGVTELDTMDEVFITNSILTIRPVASIGSVSYGDNPVTQRLQVALQQVLEEQ